VVLLAEHDGSGEEERDDEEAAYGGDDGLEGVVHGRGRVID